MQKSDLSKWAECYDNIYWIDDIPWFLNKRVFEPLSMPHTIKNVNREKVRDLILKHNALLAYWTDNWDSAESEWWWTICDNKEYDIENIDDARGRRGIRKGLRECTMSRIEPDEFSGLAYDIYKKDLIAYNYKASDILTKNRFHEAIMKKSKYEGFELWGAFVKGKLAAYATSIIIDKAVIFSNTLSDPEYYSYNPNNALFYHITKHYLCEREMDYVTNGHRSVIPHTSINEFLIRMGYRRIYSKLNLELSNFSKLLSYFGTGVTGKIIENVLRIFPSERSKFQGFSNLVKISKNF